MKIIINIAIILLLALNIANAQKFAIISDFGSNDDKQFKTAQRLKSYSPQFIVTAGDNFHKVSLAPDSMIKKYYGEFYSPRADLNNLFTVVGNHDVANPTNYYWTPGTYLQTYKEYFSGLPGNKRYYNFIKGDIEFFMVNSDFAGYKSSNRYDPNTLVWEPHGIDSNSIQGQWLKTSLRNSTAKFKIVVFHMPPYFSFPIDYDSTNHILIDTLHKRMRWPFKQWGADIVINGHNHLSELLKVDNLLYYIVNSAGASIGSWSNPHRYSIWFHQGKQSFTFVEAFKDSLQFKIIDYDNTLIKTFSIVPAKSIFIKVKTYSGADTLIATLRSPQVPYQVMATSKKFNDGIFVFPNAELNKEYLLSISHRNSITVWADKTVKLQDTVNFTNALNIAGENLFEDKMYPGDVNVDKIVDASDALSIDNDAKEFQEGYLQTDLNNDRQIDAIDMSIIESVIEKFPVEIFP